MALKNGLSEFTGFTSYQISVSIQQRLQSFLSIYYSLYFIGDIRATGNVKITNCTVDSTSKCTNRWDKHNATYTYIGQAYYVFKLDSAGSATVSGIELVLADCSTDTKR